MLKKLVSTWKIRNEKPLLNNNVLTLEWLQTTNLLFMSCLQGHSTILGQRSNLKHSVRVLVTASLAKFSSRFGFSRERGYNVRKNSDGVKMLAFII